MNRLDYLNNLLASTPDDAFLLFAVAKEHEKAANGEEALQYYARLQSVNPDYVGLYYHFGKLLEKNDRIDEAVAVYKSGIAAAKKMNDLHAKAELVGALVQWEDIEE